MTLGKLRQKHIIKIGVFDSGIGGKLIANKIKKELSGIKIFFKSDPKYFPYGDKNPKVIYQRLVYFTKWFIRLKCRIIVIACNSATTNAINKLRKKFPSLIFVGVEPPIKPIVKITKNKKVAVIGTKATINSSRIIKLEREHRNGVKIYKIICSKLAEEIENIKCFKTFYISPFKQRKIISLIKKSLDRPISHGVDVVGLACTHYPYLLPLFKKMYPAVTFYDPAAAVVRQVKKIGLELV